MTFWVTLPPASCHTRAIALSKANARACYDARWWPNLSIRRPHRHVCNDGGSGSRRRRNITTRKRCDGILVRKCVRVADKAKPTPGPACDLTCALALGRKRPNTSSRCSCSTLDETTCCQPLSPPGSNASGSTGEGRSLNATLVVRTHRPRSVTSLLSPVQLQGAPSNSCTNTVASSGCLRKIIGMESAQLAQYAEVATEASLNPMPPRHNGIEAVSHNSALGST